MPDIALFTFTSSHLVVEGLLMSLLLIAVGFAIRKCYRDDAAAFVTQTAIGAMPVLFFCVPLVKP
jgi:hypothetical protein